MKDKKIKNTDYHLVDVSMLQSSCEELSDDVVESQMPLTDIEIKTRDYLQRFNSKLESHMKRIFNDPPLAFLDIIGFPYLGNQDDKEVIKAKVCLYIEVRDYENEKPYTLSKIKLTEEPMMVIIGSEHSDLMMHCFKVLCFYLSEYVSCGIAEGEETLKW